MLRARDDADLVGQRADLRVGTADGDVDLVLALAGLADVRREVFLLLDLREGRLHVVARDLDALDLERIVFLGEERQRLRVGVALQEVEAEEAGRIGLDVRLHDRVDGELRRRRVRVVRLQRHALGDRAGERGGVDVRRHLAGAARLDHLVEVGDGAAAARLRGDDLQIGVAGVLHHERPLELVALRNRAVVLDRLDDGQARRLLLVLRLRGRGGLGGFLSALGIIFLSLRRRLRRIAGERAAHRNKGGHRDHQKTLG